MLIVVCKCTEFLIGDMFISNLHLWVDPAYTATIEKKSNFAISQVPQFFFLASFTLFLPLSSQPHRRSHCPTINLRGGGGGGELPEFFSIAAGLRGTVGAVANNDGEGSLRGGRSGEPALGSARRPRVV